MNPYEKYLSKEDKLLQAVGNYIKMQYPNVLFAHIQNENRRTKFEQYKTRQLHVKAGMPDLLIFRKHHNYIGLAIELKIKPNKPTLNQTECLAHLEQEGWRTAIIYDFDSAKSLIDEYLTNKLNIGISWKNEDVAMTC